MKKNFWVSVKFDSLEQVEELINKGLRVDIKELSKTEGFLNQEFIERNINLFNDEKIMENLCKYQVNCFSHDFIEKYFIPHGFFTTILMYQRLNEKFIEDVVIRNNQIYFSKNVKRISGLTESDTEEILWSYISKQKLSEKFISKYKNELNWSHIAEYQKLSLKFIKIFEERLVKNITNKRYLSENRYLTDDILDEYKDLLIWKRVIKNHKFTLDSLIKYKKFIIDDIWSLENSNTPKNVVKDFINFLDLSGEIIPEKDSFTPF